MKSLSVEKYMEKEEVQRLIPKTLRHIGIPWTKVNQQSTRKAVARERENWVNVKSWKSRKKVFQDRGMINHVKCC